MQHTINSFKLRTTTASCNSNCLYSELLRFPSIVGPWEDRILPPPAGERQTEEKESKNGKRERGREKAEDKVHKETDPFSPGRVSLVALPLLIWWAFGGSGRGSLSLSTVACAGRDTLCAVVRLKPVWQAVQQTLDADRHYCQNEARTRRDGSLQWSWKS